MPTAVYKEKETIVFENIQINKEIMDSLFEYRKIQIPIVTYKDIALSQYKVYDYALHDKGKTFYQLL